MSRYGRLDKIVAIVASDRFYILNFYECAFQVFYPSEHTLIYCNPYEPVPEDIVNKIKEAPTRLVVLMPDPELAIKPRSSHIGTIENWNKLQRIFFHVVRMDNYEEDEEGKKLTYEEKIKETTDEAGAYKSLNLDGTDSVYILHDIHENDTALILRDNLKQYLKEREA